MRIGIFGGSFNPVHSGHVRLACMMKKYLELDRLIIVPANVSPFKTGGGVSARDRAEMCRLAFPENEGFSVTEAEIKRGGVSYTVDTVREIKRLEPEGELFLITGSDMLLSFDRWREYKKILSICTLAAVSRCGADSPAELERFADERLRDFGRVLIVPFEPYEISSTEIRKIISHGESAAAFLPEKVNEYITERGLYLD